MLLVPKEGTPLPAVLWDLGGSGRPVLWLDGHGKEAAAQDPALRELLRAGRTVLILDPRGTGELRHSGGRGDYARHASAN